MTANVKKSPPPTYTATVHRAGEFSNTHRLTTIFATYVSACFWLLKNVFPNHITFCATIVPVALSTTFLTAAIVLFVASLILNDKRNAYISYIANNPQLFTSIDEELKTDRTFIAPLLRARQYLFRDTVAVKAIRVKELFDLIPQEVQKDPILIAGHHELYDLLNETQKKDKEFLKQLMRVDSNLFWRFPGDCKTDPEVFYEMCLTLPNINRANLDEYYQTLKSVEHPCPRMYPLQFLYEKSPVLANKTDAGNALVENFFNYTVVAKKFPQDEELALIAIRGHPILYAYASPKLSKLTSMKQALQNSIKNKLEG